MIENPVAPTTPHMNGTIASTAVASVDSSDALVKAIIELENASAPPDQTDHLNDCRWFQDQLDRGLLAPYAGTHVAVLNGEVVGSGWDTFRLQLELARKYGVHPQRILIAYIFGPSDF